MEKVYMKRAMELAVKGEGRVDPNPLVGAVIVNDGHIIGEGYHAVYGGLHAERAALASCGTSPEGADMYVTLEPCCHHGKQPPCTDAIISSGIKRVFIGSRDPNPLVSGKGVKILEDAGIEVIQDVMKSECDSINEVFFHYIKSGLPYVVLKYAMTYDGKIATHCGRSKWITGETARMRVQRDRNRFYAIMAGIGTVIKDDPLLTCRLPDARSPVRIICDTHLRLSEDSQIAKTAHRYRTIIACGGADEAPEDKADILRGYGCEIMRLPLSRSSVDLKILMKKLGNTGINSIMVEGGGELNWSVLESGIVNMIQVYVAPKIFGGRDAPSPVAGAGIAYPEEAASFSPPEITVLGSDVLMESRVIKCLQG